MWSGKAASAPSPSTVGNVSVKCEGVFMSLNTEKVVETIQEEINSNFLSQRNKWQCLEKSCIDRIILLQAQQSQCTGIYWFCERLDRLIFGLRCRHKDRVQRDPCVLTENPTFSGPVRPNSGNKPHDRRSFFYFQPSFSSHLVGTHGYGPQTRTFV